MSFQNIKSDSYCVGGRDGSATKHIYGDITSKGSKKLIGCCSICNRKISMTVIDNTIRSEGISVFFKVLDKKGVNVSKKIAKKTF